MPIRIVCNNPACHKKLKVPEQLVGKRIKCPACGTAQLADGDAPFPQAHYPAPLVETPEQLVKGKPLSVWLSLLDSPEASTCRQALWAIGQFGTAAKAAVPRLLDLLRGRDRSSQSSAASALGEIGPDAASAVPFLIRMLADSDKYYRQNAIKSLGQIGSSANDAVPALIPLLKNDELRWHVAGALGGIGPVAKAAILALIEALKEGECDRHEKAVEALARIGQEAVSPLIYALSNSDSRVRFGAADALGQIRTAAKSALATLTKALQDKVLLVRRESALALWRIGQRADLAVPVLIEALQAKQDTVFVTERWSFQGFWIVRARAADGLAEIGVHAQPAIPALLEALKDSEFCIRCAAAKAIGKISGGSKAVVNTLIRALRDEKSDVIEKATEALGEIGPRAKAALPELRRVLKTQHSSSDPELYMKVAEALWRIEPGSNLELSVFNNGLREGYLTFIRRAAAEIVGHFGADATQLIPALSELLNDDDKEVRCAARLSLQRIRDASTGGKGSDVVVSSRVTPERPIEPEPDATSTSKPKNGGSRGVSDETEGEDAARAKEAAQAGLKLLQERKYSEAADQLFAAYSLNPTDETNLVNCGVCFWLGAKEYFRLAATVTIAGCRSGSPEELFITFVCNERKLPAGLLGQQVRRAVGKEDAEGLMECIGTAERCFRKVYGSKKQGLALVWLISLLRGTGRFQECQATFSEAQRGGLLSEKDLAEAKEFVDGIPHYEADISSLTGSTGGWVIPTEHRLAKPLLKDLVSSARKASQQLG
ncbi:MAG: HEAT repeat domain-containing protein [Planctomycetes bacterium]|nr:HEAT repeat domain-containing protein [Planctomycetota bacterium]